LSARARITAARAGIGAALLGAALLSGCSDEAERCGPAQAVVADVIDGDTIVLEGGERVRYLLVDTPEITNGHDDCFGDNAAQYNRDLVLGKEVALDYDVECRDHFDRLLAYVSVEGQEVNRLLVERGYACVLYVPPNGADRVDELEDLEYAARLAGRGMWGACEVTPCS
jgi:micrococcal nuclease